jgi:acyl-CoA hydrolase
MDHLRLGSDINVSVGEVVLVEAQVVRCYQKSAEVIVRVLLDSSLAASSTQRKNETLCIAHGFFIFVRLDKQKMPTVFPQTFTETQEYELSMERRKYRQTKKDMIENSPTDSHLQSIGQQMTVTDSVAADRSLLQYTYIVLPTHANHMGNTFGGQLLEWAEEIALLSARKHLNSAALHGEDAADGTPPSEQILSTTYVHEMSFLAPSTIGDRITCQAQGCRTFGSVIEIEVIIRADNVQQETPRHINTGYFLIICRDNTRGDLVLPPLRPVTYEDKIRFESSLKRMILVTIRSKSNLDQLEVPLHLKAYRTQQQTSSSSLESSAVVPLKTMFQIYESSIWNSSSPNSTGPSSLGTVFNDLDSTMVQEYALQDTIGLLCALSSRDHPSGSSFLPSSAFSSYDQNHRWESLYSSSSSVAPSDDSQFIEMKICRGGARGDPNSRVTQLKLTSLFHQKTPVVADYILNFSRRHEWDHILSGEVKKSIVDDQIDIVRMKSGDPHEETEPHADRPGRRLIDYCLLRCHRELEDGRSVIVSRSIIHPSVPPVAGYLRGEVLPSGYLLTPVASDKESKSKDWTMLQYILQLDAISTKQFEGEAHLSSSSLPPSPLILPLSPLRLLSLPHPPLLLDCLSFSPLLLSGEMDGTSQEILASMMRLQNLLNR